MANPVPLTFQHELIETIRQDLAAFESAYPDVPYSAMVAADYAADDAGNLTSAKVVVTIVPETERVN